jgi:hypothetical protein
MADKNKFEQMLEKLIAEDRSGAEELFHEIVVEKSRTIYEKLLDDDMPEVDVDEAEEKDAEVDEKEDTEAKEDEKVDEKADEDEGDEQEVKEELVDITPVEDVPTEAGDEMGGDPTDAMIGDIEDAGDEEGEEGDAGDDEDLEDRVVDLEDALDDLKAEFDSMMDDNDGDDEEGEEGPEMDMDAGDDEEGDEEAEDEAVNAESDLDTGTAYEGKEAKANAPKDQTEQMREYVEKVNATMGDNGANTKSPVASKNDMGGDAKNIATGGEGTGGSHTGLSGNNAKEDSAGNVNVPGGKASKSLKSDSKGHGTEKKGKGEEGGTNTGSVLGS